MTLSEAEGHFCWFKTL